MDVTQAESRFLGRMNEDSFFRNSKSVANGCITCELVYYDIAGMSGGSTPDYVLAWLVKPEKSDYPVAVVKDSDQSVLYYNNGIIF